jgi:hypothetical protein
MKEMRDDSGLIDVAPGETIAVDFHITTLNEDLVELSDVTAVETHSRYFSLSLSLHSYSLLSPCGPSFLLPSLLLFSPFFLKR